MIKFEKEYLYTFVDEEEVQELIGKKGIFFDEPIGDYDLENKPLYVLTRFSPESPTPFEFEVKGEHGDIENCDSTFFYYDPNLEAKRGYENGKTIQFLLDPECNEWKDIEKPHWSNVVKYRIKPEIQSVQIDSPKEDHREYNIGDSDYSQYSYQVWDIWRDFNLNPWEADIVKRVLRHKKGEENDLKKINHILEEMMFELKNKIKQLGCRLDNIKGEYKLNDSTYNWLDCFLLDKKRDELLTLNNLYLKTSELMK